MGKIRRDNDRGGVITPSNKYDADGKYIGRPDTTTTTNEGDAFYVPGSGVAPKRKPKARSKAKKARRVSRGN